MKFYTTYFKYSILIGLLTFLIVACTGQKIADITIDKVTPELKEASKLYDELDGFHEGLACVRKDNKYGFIDKLGKLIIPCSFDEASEFKFGVSIIKIDDKEGLINTKGDFVIPCEYEVLNPIEEDSLIIAYRNNKAGVFDITGKLIIPFKYEFMSHFSEGLAAVRNRDGLYGFINKSGKIIIPCQYEDVDCGYGFSEGLVAVEKDGRFGYINSTGAIVIPFSDKLTGQRFSYGLTTISRGSDFDTDSNGEPIPYAMAFINKEGKRVSEYVEVANIQDFRDGYSVVTDKNRFQGLLIAGGNFIVPCEYSLIANGFDNEYVCVQKYPKWGFIRKTTGQITIPIVYDDMCWTFNEGLVNAKKNGKWGYINEDNEIVIPFVYDSACPFSEGFGVVSKFGKYGYVDRYGNDTFN